MKAVFESTLVTVSGVGIGVVVFLAAFFLSVGRLGVRALDPKNDFGVVSVKNPKARSKVWFVEVGVRVGHLWTAFCVGGRL